MKVKIDIDTKVFVRFWLVVIGFSVAIGAIYLSRVALGMIGAALFLALALNPPVGFLAKHLPGKSRVGGTLLAFLSVVVILGAFIVLVIPPIVQQTSRFIGTVPGLVEDFTEKSQGVRNFIDQNPVVQEQVDNALNSLKANASSMASNISSALISSTGAVINGLFTLIIVLVMSFLMLVEGPNIVKSLKNLYRDKKRRDNHTKIMMKMYRVVVGYVNGQILVAGCAGFFAGLAIFILSLCIPEVSVSLAIPVAAITFVGTMIPLFGATLAAILVALLLLTSSVWGAIIYVIFVVVYQQVENNFISPQIQSKKIEISALTIILAVTIGVYVFGVAGAIISIPVAGCIRVLFENYLETREEKNEPPKKKLHEHIIDRLKKKTVEKI